MSDPVVAYVVQMHPGAHSDKVLREIMRRVGCGPTKAGNLLRAAVLRGEVRVEGLRVYPGEVA